MKKIILSFFFLFFLTACGGGHQWIVQPEITNIGGGQGYTHTGGLGYGLYYPQSKLLVTNNTSFPYIVVSVDGKERKGAIAQGQEVILRVKNFPHPRTAEVLVRAFDAQGRFVGAVERKFYFPKTGPYSQYNGGPTGLSQAWVVSGYEIREPHRRQSQFP